MQALVTGCAGFIGSSLVDQLLAEGHAVRGVDAFTEYYDPALKRRNLETAMRHSAFEFVEADLRTRDLRPLLGGVDVVFHQAAQPGVRLSWSEGFVSYAEQNILATQRLLEAAKDRALSRFVYASSSSIYGNAPAFPTTEETRPSPYSPYGVTKLAGEHLCNAYAANWRVPAVSLRYFTVYGPRQRPDMAMHRLIDACFRDELFPLYGDGTQVRDFTFVDDVVRANLVAASADIEPGSVFNVAGGSSATMNEVLAIVEEAVDRSVRVVRHGAQPGDVARTGGSIERLGALGWSPRVDLRSGITRQVAWHREWLGIR